jgi:tellurite resistance protein TerC
MRGLHLHPPELFPIERVWWIYGLFVLMILGSLFLDMRRRNGKEHELSHREALFNVLFWIGFALLFCVALYFYGLHAFPGDPRLAGYDHRVLARQSSLEFLSGWLVEKSLSIDNVFIFIVVFDFFAILPKYRHKILFYGILGAMVFRGIFIALGSVLMQISWVPLFFGVFLAFTGLKVAFGPESHPDPAENVLFRLLKKFLPITPTLRDGKFLIRESGRLMGTPLLLTLVFIEFTDIVFAVDSVPAIFAITGEPFIVFTSNIFAILGLRALFFLLAGIMEKFHYLKYGLGFILCFVGLKMSWLDRHFDGHFPTIWSLGIIVVALAAAAFFSWLLPLKKEEGGV